MALSDDKLWHLWNAQGTDVMSKAEAFVFARAWEAEVRKQDEALILQLVEALTVSSPNTDRDYGWNPEDWTKRRADALAAARARLEGKP